MTKSKPLKILIVEDEPLLAMDVEMMVEDAGHVVVAEAASLFDVEELDAEVAPDIAFVDMHLAKGTNGLDVSALIQERWKAAIIIFVTANPAMIPPDFAGAHGVIPKPFSRNGFMSAINYIVEGITAPPPMSLKPGDFVAAERLTAGFAV
ncbi:MAG: response regulator [Hyphomicrobiales bacterium]|nr:MAG: response regulator [Hyphomicrobiales bacterium]